MANKMERESLLDYYLARKFHRNPLLIFFVTMLTNKTSALLKLRKDNNKLTTDKQQFVHIAVETPAPQDCQGRAACTEPTFSCL